MLETVQNYKTSVPAVLKTCIALSAILSNSSVMASLHSIGMFADAGSAECCRIARDEFIVQQDSAPAHRTCGWYHMTVLMCVRKLHGGCQLNLPHKTENLKQNKKPSCRWGTVRARYHLESGKILQKCSHLKRPATGELPSRSFYGHQHWCHSIGHTWFPISLSLKVCLWCTVFEMLTVFAQHLWRHVTLTTPIWGTFGPVKVTSSHSQPVHKIWRLQL